MLDTKQLLLEFSALTGVSGAEEEACRYGAEKLAAFGAVETSPLGSVICTVRKPLEGEAHIMLDAHIDEIGMIVTYIEEGGFLRVGNCGGIDRRLLLASPVEVHTGKETLSGVVCSVPPHLNTGGDNKNKKVDEIYIDIGYSKEEAEKRVSPGDRITISSQPRSLLGDQVSGKALDDRAGCAALLKTLEYLKEEELGCGLTVVFSTMEETGHQGAHTATYQVNPTHALAVDVGFAHTPGAPKEKCGILGKGPMIGFAPILDGALSRSLVELAKGENIPWQPDVMGGSTGTNADNIAPARGGVVTALVSIPQKYMHSPIETVSVQDVEDTARLLSAWIKTFPKGGAAL